MLEEGIRSQQWLTYKREAFTNYSEDRGATRLALQFRVFSGDRFLGKVYRVLEGVEVAIERFSQPLLRLCPYWSHEHAAVCFREIGGEDLNLRFDADALSSPPLRPLGELAVEEGYITSLLGMFPAYLALPLFNFPVHA